MLFVRLTWWRAMCDFSHLTVFTNLVDYFYDMLRELYWFFINCCRSQFYVIILFPIALFASLSRRGLGTRNEGLWKQRISQSYILGLSVVRYAVVIFLGLSMRHDSRNFCLIGINLKNVSVSEEQKEAIWNIGFFWKKWHYSVSFYRQSLIFQLLSCGFLTPGMERLNRSLIVLLQFIFALLTLNDTVTYVNLQYNYLHY